MKTVLVIASDFPPLVGTNTQRVQSFIRHLPSFGWTSRVITQAIADLPQIDSRELRGVPSGICVTRVPNPDPFAVRARLLGNGPPDMAADLSGCAEGRGQACPTGGEKEDANQSLPTRWVREVGSSVVKAVLRTFFYIPDPLRLWAERVGTVGVEGELEGLQAVLSSSPAYSCHLAGLALKRRLGVPWVADFRDLWVGRPYRVAPKYMNALRDRRLEAKVVAECDRIVLASPAWANTFMGRYGDDIQSKLTVITNGYDAEVLDDARLRVCPRSPDRTSPRFLLTGSMHEGESPVPFIRALGAIRAGDPKLVAGVKVEFVGSSGQVQSTIQREIDANGLTAHFNIISATSNTECIAKQLDADCLLLFLSAAHAETVCGKGFEYMATGRPILACVPTNGVQAEILRQAGTAIIVDHGDVEAITCALRGFLSNGGNQCEPAWTYIKTFERQVLTKKLAAILDEVIV